MATPTASALAGKHPTSQAVATPPVSTPFSAHNHPAFSPHGPRSVVPSPQQFKKSPANSNTLYGYPSGSVGGGHPSNSSFGAGYDSPSAAMALGGVDILDGMGAPGMGGLGVLGALGRGDEDERKRRLGLVVDILKTNKGRLSEAGIERLARKVGLECLWETHMGSGGSKKTLIIAGSALALDIDFEKDVVKKVALSFPDSPESVTRFTEKAGRVLMRDLEFKAGDSPLTKMLDQFAGNLERLAMLDRLSIIPGLNCHEAIAGIYESLEKLHRWEVERLKGQEEASGKGEDWVERMAMCGKSGKPVMHTRDRLGLSLDYWQEKRLLAKTKQEPKTWSLLVECAPLPAPPMVYPSIRVSEKWISPEIQKDNLPAEDLFLTTESVVLDWLEPEDTLLPSSEPPKDDEMEGIEVGNQKVPEVIFVVRFDPPLIVPFGIAQQLHNLTNAPMDMSQLSSFDRLMFPHGPENKFDAGEGRTIKQRTTVPVFSKDGEKLSSVHQNTLFIEKIDYGHALTELPFSHPRRLVEMLPFLRQYAFLSTLLSKSFSSKSKEAPLEPKKQTEKKNKQDEFAAFMDASSPSSSLSLKIDISLTIQPILRLQVVFPFEKNPKNTATVIFDIKLNGIVEIVSEDIFPKVVNLDGDEGGERVEEGEIKVADLGTILEITEDLGIWVEFVRRRLG